MKQLRQWWEDHKYLLLAAVSFLAAVLQFLLPLLGRGNLLNIVAALVLALQGMRWMDWHYVGPPEK